MTLQVDYLDDVCKGIITQEYVIDIINSMYTQLPNMIKEQLIRPVVPPSDLRDHVLGFIYYNHTYDVGFHLYAILLDSSLSLPLEHQCTAWRPGKNCRVDLTFPAKTYIKAYVHLNSIYDDVMFSKAIVNL